ncbi:hypothetical protein RE9414_29690 [Prescottella equi]|nr:hypothetical protein RE9414_29690 [Prescottella equi]
MVGFTEKDAPSGAVVEVDAGFDLKIEGLEHPVGIFAYEHLQGVVCNQRGPVVGFGVTDGLSICSIQFWGSESEVRSVVPAAAVAGAVVGVEASMSVGAPRLMHKTSNLFCGWEPRWFDLLAVGVGRVGLRWGRTVRYGPISLCVE